MKDLFVVLTRCETDCNDVSVEVWDDFTSACVAQIRMCRLISVEEAVEMISDELLEQIRLILTERKQFKYISGNREAILFYAPVSRINRKFDEFQPQEPG